MIFELIFFASPLLLCGGLFIKNKNLCSLYCGTLFFLLSALYFSDAFYGISDISTDMTAYSGMLSPAYIYGSQLIGMFSSDYRVLTVVWSLLSTLVLMLYIYKYCYYTAPSAITAAASGLWFLYFTDFTFFFGIIIAAFAFRYASEKRFVRFLAVMLLAACFDLRLLLLIPLYVIFITKPTLYHIPAAAALGGLLLIVDFSPVFGAVFGYPAERNGAGIFMPAAIIAVCIIAALMAKILMRRSSYNASMITVMAVSAVLAVGAIADERFLVLALACFYPAALTLVPEIIAAFKSILTLTFREKKRPALIVGGSILVLGFAVYYFFLCQKEGFTYTVWLFNEAVIIS